MSERFEVPTPHFGYARDLHNASGYYCFLRILFAMVETSMKNFLKRLAEVKTVTLKLFELFHLWIALALLLTWELRHAFGR
jgi:hypothetical protein